MKKSSSKEPVELIRPFWMKKRYHAADVVQTLDLGTKGCFLVEITVHEIAVFFRGYSAHPVDTDATRVPYHLAHHVFCHLIFVPTHREVHVAPLTPVSTVDKGKTFSSILVRSPRL